VGFEPAIPASERPQTHALDRTASGIGNNNVTIIITINTADVEYKNKGDASNNRSNWNRFKIVQKILEQRTGKARYQGTTENSHIGHSTHTAESANLEAQKSLISKTALYAPLTVRAE
jgi:hypothetical protein